MKIISMLLVALALVTLAAVDTTACSCPTVGPDDPFRAKVKSSQAVFSGEVVEITDKDKRREVTFHVAEFWKSELLEEVKVSTDRLTSSCAYNFEVGKDYLVFAGLWENELYTGDCSRNLEIEKAGDELKILGKGKTPEKKKQ